MKMLKMNFLSLVLFCSTSLCSAQVLTAPGFESPGQNATITLPVVIQGLTFKRIVNSVWHPGQSNVAAHIAIVYKDDQGIDRIQAQTTIRASVDVNGNWAVGTVSLSPPPANAASPQLKVVAWQEWNGQKSSEVLLICNIKQPLMKKIPEQKKIIKKPIFTKPPVIKKSSGVMVNPS